MRVVIQRVRHCSVRVSGQVVGEIGEGLLVLLGVGHEDSSEDVTWLVNKVVNLRIFNDENGVMNRSLLDVGKDALVVSQFTLLASTKKGNRPSYIRSAKPEVSIPLYETFVKELQNRLARPVPTGKFGADMQVELVNDGPVTIIIDSKNKE